jgi:hypothetical protein
VQSLEELPFGPRTYALDAVCKGFSSREDSLPHFHRRVKQDGQAQGAAVPQSLLYYQTLDERNVGEERSLKIPRRVVFRVGRKAFRILQSCKISLRPSRKTYELTKTCSSHSKQPVVKRSIWCASVAIGLAGRQTTGC